MVNKKKGQKFCGICHKERQALASQLSVGFKRDSFKGMRFDDLVQIELKIIRLEYHTTKNGEKFLDFINKKVNDIIEAQKNRKQK